MTRKKDPYHKYVEHPHYGRRPRCTGSNPNIFDPAVSLRSDAISSKEIEVLYRGKRFSHLLDELESPRVPNTAIMADQSKQLQNSYNRVTHYFDLDKVCIECKRPFIFFAQEQKHWFEALGFSLDTQGSRCFDCRKRVRDKALMLKNYDHLTQVGARTRAQNLAMADILLALIESGTFPATNATRVRALLNKASKQLVGPPAPNPDSVGAILLQRVLAIEASSKSDAPLATRVNWSS